MAQNARPSSQLLLKFVISIFCKKKNREVKQLLNSSGCDCGGSSSLTS